VDPDLLDPGALAGQLKGWALEAGFHRAGIASLEPSRYAEALRAWLGRGDHAGMAWLERRLERRLDASTLLAGARSALVVALHYQPPRAPAGDAEGDLWPRVARYARGRDYHEVMEGRLKRLESRLAAVRPDIGTRRYVDTGPLLERELAARAGLGAIGKHTNLLHPQHGSWFLLGELLLTVELPAEFPVADPCGSCSRCLTACPTGALPEPYRLDARRCISYWTIEHRGIIPRDLRPMLGDWVFGCDLCQEACPWNEGPPGAADPELELPEARGRLDLQTLLDLSLEGYQEAFRGSPMKRARREGLRRNAATAMGNRKEARYLPVLIRALADESPVIRAHVAWALGRIGGEVARSALLSALAGEADGEVREEIAVAVAGADPEARI
jgi:epoxyqueuosine reductase